MYKSLATAVLATSLSLAASARAGGPPQNALPSAADFFPASYRHATGPQTAPPPAPASTPVPPQASGRVRIRTTADGPSIPADDRVRRTQSPGSPVDAPALPLPDPRAAAPATPAEAAIGLAADLDAAEGSAPSLSLQAALYGSITNNPDLIALRNNSVASPEAVEVARRLPTALNPTVWIDYRPITLIPRDTFANSTTGGTSANKPYYHHGQNYFLFSIRQPIELGRQTQHRYAIARAALTQQQWTVVQAELLALVQTYRFFQTAAYRREKLRVAGQLAEFNDRLLTSLNKRLEANQVASADVVLARVENETTRQLVDVARQEYANALADLRNQVGIPETAGTAEPLGEFVLPRGITPVDENELIRLALCSRPEIHAARATAAGALAAVNLARGDRIPTPVVGPQYAIDEAGIQYVGLVLVSTIPVVNDGAPLVRQREADYRRALVAAQQVEKRTVIQVRAASAKWNAATRLVGRSSGLTETLKGQVESMRKLFDANQADLTKLLQSQQRLIQIENAGLDALWQATQAQADLLTALGVPNLIAGLQALPRQEAVAPMSSSAPPTVRR